MLTGGPAATPDDVAVWLRLLVAELGVPGLGAYGVGPAIIEELVEKAARASSMKANPVELTRQELAAIIEEAI